MNQPNNLDATVFVYQRTDTGEIRAHYVDAARDFERDEDRWLWEQTRKAVQHEHTTRSPAAG